MTKLRGGAATDVGRVRTDQRGPLPVADESLFAVADGVGGHQAGEVASQTAVETLARAFTDRTHRRAGRGGPSGQPRGVAAGPGQPREAGHGHHPHRRGPGRRRTARSSWPSPTSATPGPTCSSRASSCSSPRTTAWSRSWSARASSPARRPRSTPSARSSPGPSGMEPRGRGRLLGAHPLQRRPPPAVQRRPHQRGHRRRIASTLRQLADPEEAAQRPGRQARADGGSDNITVVVVDVVDDDGRAAGRRPRPSPEDETESATGDEARRRRPRGATRDGDGDGGTKRATSAPRRLADRACSSRRLRSKTPPRAAPQQRGVTGGWSSSRPRSSSCCWSSSPPSPGTPGAPTRRASTATRSPSSGAARAAAVVRADPRAAQAPLRVDEVLPKAHARARDGPRGLEPQGRGRPLRQRPPPGGRGAAGRRRPPRRRHPAGPGSPGTDDRDHEP